MRRVFVSARSIATMLAAVALAGVLLWFLLPALQKWGGLIGLVQPVVPPAKPTPTGKPPKDEPDKPKPKGDFDKLKIAALPHDGQDLTQSLKPGHWTSATIEAKANNFDFRGELDAEVTSNGLPVDLEHTAYRLLSNRPVGLPKGQGKRLELVFFPPRSVTTNLVIDLLGPGRVKALQDSQPFSHLPAYQYFMYVLSSQPGRYAYLRVLDTVKPPWGELSQKERDEYYRVLLPQVGSSVGLPSQPLVWSSIAVLVWDDIHPKVLNANQQQALLDWLHWGGQIVISGPRTLDLLRGSFLDVYLPAEGAESITLDERAIDELNEHWTIDTPHATPSPLAITQPWPAVRLAKRKEGSFVPGTGKLLAERRVGRGRIVVSAFRLTEPDLTRWRSFDSFVNSALLRRPSRIYANDSALETIIDWVRWLPAASRRNEHAFAIDPDERFNPGLVTNVRYFSRDGGTADARKKLADAAGIPVDLQENLSQLTSLNAEPLESPERDDARSLFAAAHNPGVGGWSDFTPVADAARASLREAAGIVVPDRTFVIWTIGLYLLAIVPLNWFCFWLMGRVEWAWVAAPLISVACAFSVIRMAQLDIGFARSTSEIAIVELQGSYPRAHVTRFTALYTSLSTAYDVRFDDHSALAAPFSTNPAFRLLTGQEATPVMYRRDAEVRLTGFQVASNSTGMLRSEYMHEVGPILFENDRGEARLTNRTTLTLEDAVVLHRDLAFTEVARLGTLRSGAEVTLDFQLWQPLRTKETPSPGTPPADVADSAPTTSAVERIGIQQLVEIAEDLETLNPGDVRLVARTEGVVPGIEILPQAAQHRQTTLVVANLVTGLGPEPQPDINTRAEVAKPEYDSTDPEAPTLLP